MNFKAPIGPLSSFATTRRGRGGTKCGLELRYKKMIDLLKKDDIKSDKKCYKKPNCQFCEIENNNYSLTKSREI